MKNLTEIIYCSIIVIVFTVVLHFLSLPHIKSIIINEVRHEVKIAIEDEYIKSLLTK